MEDSKPHTRNLKLISVAFILYWLLELEPAKDEIHLNIISYKISNPDPLTVLAWLALVYFLWRFFLAKPLFIQTFRNLKSSFYNNQISEDSGIVSAALRNIAKSDFNENHSQKFEKFISEESKKYRRQYKYSGLEAHKLVKHQGQTELEYSSQATEVNKKARINKTFKLPISPWILTLINSKLVLDLVVKNEDSADYILPLLLFVLAVVCGIMIACDYTPSELMGSMALR